MTPWTRAAAEIETSKRRASSSPACGPAPVTTVPVRMATPVAVASAHTIVLDAPVTTVVRGAVVRLPRPVDEDHGRADEDHRQQQVSLDGDRMEVDEHGDAAEHDLTDDARHEAEREQGQVAPPGHAPQRAEHGRDDGEGHQAGEQPVDLLDRGVVGGDVDEPLVAAPRPVVAPEPRPGESHGRPGDDDDHQRHATPRP